MCSNPERVSKRLGSQTQNWQELGQKAVVSEVAVTISSMKPREIDMGKYLLALAAASLAGCAPTVKNATDSGVIIQAYSNDASQTQILADAECKKYDKRARLNQAVRNNNVESSFFFDCI